MDILILKSEKWSDFDDFGSDYRIFEKSGNKFALWTKKWSWKERNFARMERKRAEFQQNWSGKKRNLTSWNHMAPCLWHFSCKCGSDSTCRGKLHSITKKVARSYASGQPRMRLFQRSGRYCQPNKSKDSSLRWRCTAVNWVYSVLSVCM